MSASTLPGWSSTVGNKKHPFSEKKRTLNVGGVFTRNLLRFEGHFFCDWASHFYNTFCNFIIQNEDIRIPDCTPTGFVTMLSYIYTQRTDLIVSSTTFIWPQKGTDVITNSEIWWSCKSVHTVRGYLHNIWWSRWFIKLRFMGFHLVPPDPQRSRRWCTMWRKLSHVGRKQHHRYHVLRTKVPTHSPPKNLFALHQGTAQVQTHKPSRTILCLCAEQGGDFFFCSAFINLIQNDFWIHKPWKQNKKQ